MKNVAESASIDEEPASCSNRISARADHMTAFQRFMRWYVASNLLATSALTLLLFVTAHLTSAPVDPLTVALAFSSTVTIYNIDHWRDAKRSQIARRGFDVRLATIVLTGLVTAVCFIASPWRVEAVFLVYVGLGVFHGLSLRGKRLKDVPALKSLFVTAAVVFAAVALPLATSQHRFDADALQAVLILVAVFMVNTHLCDIIDLETDLAEATPTLPATVGVPATRRILYFVLATTTLALLVGWLSHRFSPHPELLLMLVVSFVLARSVGPNESRFRGHLIVDAALYLLPVLSFSHRAAELLSP